MNLVQRRAKIVEIVRRNKTVFVEDLAGQLDSSRETIRRDLSELGKTGEILRIHGGATMPKMFGESSFQDRLSKNAEAKIRIAKKAAEIIREDETLLLNTGTSTLYFAEELGRMSNLTIATNSAEIAHIVATKQPGNRTILLGGEYVAANRQTLGPMLAEQIKKLRAHHCVLSIGAIDIQTGLMEFSLAEAHLAMAMIEQSLSITVLADKTKFNMLASFSVCSLSRISRLICDEPPPKEIVEAITSGGGKTILAD